MSEVLYKFENIYNKTQSKYIFQYVKNRKLTNVYHSHDFYEIIYFLKGNATQIINAKEISFEPNLIVLLRPKDKHRFISQSAGTVVVSLSIQKEEFGLLAETFNSSLLTEIDDATDTIIYSKSYLLPYTSVDFEKLSFNEKEEEFKFLLLCFLKSYIDRKDEKEYIPKVLSDAISEMKKTDNLRIGIDAFTELSSYSHSHLSRLIKKHFNMTLKQYINELRLQKAYHCIIFTQKSAEEISEELGFASYSHFNKIFKARFSITPASLRKQNGIWTA